jgi:hypothetical protein
MWDVSLVVLARRSLNQRRIEREKAESRVNRGEPWDATEPHSGSHVSHHSVAKYEAPECYEVAVRQVSACDPLLVEEGPVRTTIVEDPCPGSVQREDSVSP